MPHLYTVSFRKRDLYLVALLQKETCNLRHSIFSGSSAERDLQFIRHSMHRCHPVLRRQLLRKNIIYIFTCLFPQKRVIFSGSSAETGLQLLCIFATLYCGDSCCARIYISLPVSFLKRDLYSVALLQKETLYCGDSRLSSCASGGSARCSARHFGYSSIVCAVVHLVAS